MNRFSQIIAALLVGAINDITNEQRRTLLQNVVTKSADVQAAALEFDEAIGEDGAAEQVGEGLVDLAKLLTGPRNLDEDKKQQIKDVVSRIVDLPDENAEQKAETFFSSLVEAIDALQELSDFENAQPGGTGEEV